jgi:hypothetical protein
VCKFWDDLVYQEVDGDLAQIFFGDLVIKSLKS